MDTNIPVASFVTGFFLQRISLGFALIILVCAILEFFTYLPDRYIYTRYRNMCVLLFVHLVTFPDQPGKIWAVIPQRAFIP